MAARIRFLAALAVLAALMSSSPALVRADGPAALFKTIGVPTQTYGAGGVSIVSGGNAYFAGNDPRYGLEPWKTDGTAAGTVMIGDFWPGTTGSYAFVQLELNGLLLMNISTPDLGTELWASDGTAGGTTLLKDIAPGPGGSYPSNFVKIGSVAYFSASDGTTGSELWKTDGTTAGTLLVADLAPGFEGSTPEYLTPVGNGLYFTIRTSTGSNLYYTTGSGATQVTGPGLTYVAAAYNGIVALNPTTAIFSGYSAATGFELWTAVGTSATVIDKISGSTGISPQYLTKLNSYVLFTATDSTNGNELWRSDGTLGGTTRICELSTTIAGSSYPNNLTAIGNYVYFSAGGSSGTEPYRSDGSSCTLFDDIEPGGGSSSPNNFVGLGSEIYYTASTGAKGTELYKSTGAPLSGALVKDIAGGPASSSPSSLRVLGSIVLFVADNGTSGQELWRSNGTDAGTFLIKEIGPTAADAGFYPGSGGAALVGGTLFFRATDSTGAELWRSDGTPSGTYRLKDINGGSGSSYPSGLTPFGSKLLFGAVDPTAGLEPFTSDGTTGGTSIVKDIYPASYGLQTNGNKTFGVLQNGIALFTASDPGGEYRLYKTDGTSPNTVLLKDIFPGDRAFPTEFTTFGDLVFFVASDATTGRELWKSNGTPTGTDRVKDINAQVVNGVNLGSTPQNLTVAGGKLFFVANDGLNGQQLWVNDGTSTGTTMPRLINPAGSALPGFLQNRLVAVGSSVYFAATNNVNGVELWRSDGTAAGTVQVKDINPGAGGSNPSNLTAVGGSLYFVASNGVSGREIWKSDGTAAGTVMVADLTPGAASTPVIELSAVGRHLIASLAAGGTGFELYQTTGGAPNLLSDIVAGANGSAPQSFAAFGDTLLFSADDSGLGANRQLWSIAISAINKPPSTTGASSTVQAGSSVDGSVTASDPDDLSLTFAIVTNGAKGTASLNPANGAFTYAANAGTSGADTVTYTVSDGEASVTGTIAVTITAAPSSNASVIVIPAVVNGVTIG